MGVIEFKLPSKITAKEKEQETDDWLKILAYIGAKRTGEQKFKDLFNRILNEVNTQRKPARHTYYEAASFLKDCYDFTPIRALDKKTAENPKTSNR